MKRSIVFALVFMLLFVSGCGGNVGTTESKDGDNPSSGESLLLGESQEHDCSKFRSEWREAEGIACGATGKKQIVCTECGKVLNEKEFTKEHQYIGTVIAEKTCSQVGQTEHKCTVCGHSYIEDNGYGSHGNRIIEVVTEAGENSLGTKKACCTDCNGVLREFSYVDNAYHRNGKLSVQGPDLVNQYGEKFQLFGLSTHGLQWFGEVVNFDTLCSIQESFGNNVFRLALYTDESGYCDGSPSVKREMLEALERGIDIATELGLYVIVDWHMVGATNPADKNPLTYLDEAKEFFSYISEKYKDHDNILYEIMNEPNGPTTWVQCKRYAEQVIPCIRANTDAVILVGSPEWTTDLYTIMENPLVGFENIMYTYHFYAADHRRTTRVEKAYDSGLPVFISEFGFMESSGDGGISTSNGNKWKQVLDSRNISYVAWNISNSQGSASIFKHKTTDLVDVSDNNLKVWGVYLKDWYRSKSLGE